MTEQLIISQLQHLPEHLKVEVLHYVEFLKKQHEKGGKTGQDKKPVFGSAKGKYKLAEDFDEPLEDFKGYM